MKIALLASATGRLSGDDECLARAMVAADWQVQACAWTEDRDWSDFSAVVVRSPYDYIHSPQAFLGRLEQIEQQAGRLFNPLALMRWNLDKRYLIPLQQAAIPAVPSVLMADGPSIDAVVRASSQLQTGSLVLKPVVGASASGVLRLRDVADRDQLAIQLAEVGTAPCLVQPYLASIETDGEMSLIYFNKRFSHAVCKRPASDDFRVQSEHGGSVTPFTPSLELQRSGQRLLESERSPMLYARVDVVRPDPVRKPDKYRLMELELIEPELFFRMDAHYPSRFIQALVSLSARDS